ncbi:MAG TPA: metallophosphoesterase family protein, partial [Polyangiales bacterium]
MRAQKARSRGLHSTGTSVQLRADGSLVLAVVADTHSKPHPRAADWIAQLAPDAVLHAGDIGDLSVLEQLTELGRVIAVRGNIDERAHDVPDAVSVELRHDDERVLTMLLMHIAVAGPRIRSDAATLAQEAGAKLIVCGHSHVPFIGRDRGLTVFNPGSI